MEIRLISCWHVSHDSLHSVSFNRCYVGLCWLICVLDSEDWRFFWADGVRVKWWNEVRLRLSSLHTAAVQWRLCFFTQPETVGLMAPWSIIHDLHSMRLALAKLWKFKYKKVCIPPLEIILSYIDRRWWASFRRRRRRSGVCYPFSGLSLRAKRFVLPWKKRSSKKRYIFSSLYSSIGVFAYHLNVICQNQIFNHVWWNLCDNHEWYILGFDSRFNFFLLPTREKRRKEKV